MAWEIIIKVWNLPLDLDEKRLRLLHKSIVRELVERSKLGVKSESDCMTLFPTDRMAYGAGEEILIEVRSLRPIDNFERGALAKRLEVGVGFLFPDAIIGCHIL